MFKNLFLVVFTLFFLLISCGKGEKDGSLNPSNLQGWWKAHSVEESGSCDEIYYSRPVSGDDYYDNLYLLVYLNENGLLKIHDLYCYRDDLSAESCRSELVLLVKMDDEGVAVLESESGVDLDMEGIDCKIKYQYKWMIVFNDDKNVDSIEEFVLLAEGADCNTDAANEYIKEAYDEDDEISDPLNVKNCSLSHKISYVKVSDVVEDIDFDDDGNILGLEKDL